MSSVIGNLEYSFLMFQPLQNQARLWIEGGHFQHLL
jgi:hypothetical protein